MLLPRGGDHRKRMRGLLHAAGDGGLAAESGLLRALGTKYSGTNTFFGISEIFLGVF